MVNDSLSFNSFPDKANAIAVSLMQSPHADDGLAPILVNLREDAFRLPFSSPEGI